MQGYRVDYARSRDTVVAVVLLALGSVADIWLAGRGRQSRRRPPAVYRLLRGYGWVRPSLDDQRRYLTSLGGRYRELASYSPPFAGAYTTDASGTTTWRFAELFTFVGDPEDERYALAGSGLWAATPNTARCRRSASLTLLAERAVTELRFDGQTAWIISRAVPGYFQYVEYQVPPPGARNVGYKLLAEDGTWLDGCCN